MSDNRPPWWNRWWGLTLIAVSVLVVAGALQNGSGEEPASVEAAADEVEGLASPTPSSSPSLSSSPRPVVRTGVVTNIVDGDTLDLDDGTRVRLAIVDTPEVHGAMQRCGQGASAFARDGVLGTRVSILRPGGAPATDAFDRTVGEVVRGDGYSLNVALVDAGASPTGDCHPAYTPCVPPARPDLDCADVDGPIQVDHAHGDPHRFDRDADGVGCEG